MSQFKFKDDLGWTDVGEEVTWGTSKKRAPVLDDKAGWIKKVSVDYLPKRLHVDNRGRSRKYAFVFIHYLGQPPVA